MSENVLEIKGFEELERALRETPEVALPVLEEAMQKSLALLHDATVEYPPATEANRPGRVGQDGRPLGYYERGRGWWYPVKRLSPSLSPEGAGREGKRAGVIRLGKKKAVKLKVAGYRLRRSSERLGTKWTSRVQAGRDGVIGELGTTVSYADYVQGAQQTDLFGQRGWVRVDEALAAATPEILVVFGEAVDKVAGSLNGSR